MHELEGAKLKIKRAKTHINGLARSTNSWRIKHEYSVIQDQQTNAPHVTYRVDPSPSAPVIWSVMVGTSLATCVPPWTTSHGSCL